MTLISSLGRIITLVLVLVKRLTSASQALYPCITQLIITDSKAMLAVSPLLLPDLIIFAGLTVLTRVCRGWARRPTLGGECPGTAGWTRPADRASSRWSSRSLQSSSSPALPPLPLRPRLPHSPPSPAHSHSPRRGGATASPGTSGKYSTNRGGREQYNIQGQSLTSLYKYLNLVGWLFSLSLSQTNEQELELISMLFLISCHSSSKTPAAEHLYKFDFTLN